MNTKETAQNLLWLLYGLLAITFFHLVYVVMPSLTLAFITNTVLMFFILIWILKKRAVKVALEQSFNIEDLFSGIESALPTKASLKDENSRYLACNQAFAQEFGITSEQLRGKTDFDLFPAELANKYQQDDREVIAKKRVAILTETFTSAGQTKSAQTIKIPFLDHTSGKHLLLGIFFDLTEMDNALHTANEFKMTLDLLDEGVYIFSSKDYKICYANKSGQQQLGYNPEELCRLTPYDFKPDFTARKFLDLVAPLLNHEKPFIIFDTLHQRKDGQRFKVSIKLQLIHLGGTESQFIALATPIE
jgi:PAS domain S-box-containing protein